MAVMKCKMCGGDLEIEEGMSVAVCEYCGTKQTVPTLDNERKTSLFGRAGRLLRACEFDKASVVFGDIVSEFPEEAEAYWGLLLCKYGVEYVDDPATGKKIPTCHRLSFESVMEDNDFEQACENADSVARGVYREEAKFLENLRKNVIEVSSKEEPYDVFICYKETDANGDRTIDSVMAQDVYDALTEKGLRVFFARITLEDKLGMEYEPYIFAALNSAKVMLAIGTDYEYFNAVWVKNEWNRFLKLVAKGEKKVLIPCYKDIDAYDMPKEFKNLQAQDMGKLGFMQDLTRGVCKILGVEEKKEAVVEKTVVKETVVSESASKANSLLERALIFLEDGKWKDADNYAEKVLDLDAKNAMAYLCKLCAELKIGKVEKLLDSSVNFENRDNFKKAVRFADEHLRAKLEKVIETIKKRQEQERVKELYDEACEAMELAKTEEEYRNAEFLFGIISDFQDSEEKENECIKLAAEAKKKALAEAKNAKKQVVYDEAKKKIKEGDFPSASKLYESIIDFKDSAERKNKCIEMNALEDEKKSFEKEYASTNALFNGKRKKELGIKLEEVKNKISKIKDSFRRSDMGEKYYNLWKNLKVGELFVFGDYHGENEWIVLEKQDTKLLLLSKKAVDYQPYNEKGNKNTWEFCQLRKWLNKDYFNEAFSSEEQKMILITKLPDASDNVFILSQEEVKKFFPLKEKRFCSASGYLKAKYKEVRISEAGYCYWWLRSPAADKDGASFVNCFGEIDKYGYYVGIDINGVRPAMWIDLDV